MNISPVVIAIMVMVTAAPSAQSKSVGLNQKNAFLDMVHKLGKHDMVCDLCMKWVEQIEHLIDEGLIYKEIIAAMRVYCQGIEIGFPNIAKECNAIVDDIDKVIHLVINEVFPPQHICCDYYHACDDQTCAATTAEPVTETSTVEEETTPETKTTA